MAGGVAEADRSPSLVTFVKGVGLFTLLTVVMTWPQALRLTTGAQNHQDVFFNMWRLAWVAHALRTAPLHVLDGNIFYPEPRTLTFSDAMPLEGVLAAPLLWSHVPPVLVHNLILLAGIVLSAAGALVLAVHLTGSRAAGVTAGIIFAFAPYRFEHYMHMELQWTVWIPWAFLALHRLVDTGQARYGWLLGTCLALQFMSSVYYGVFLATLLCSCGVLFLCATERHRVGRNLSLLAISGLTAAMLCLPYVLPYAVTRERVGPRSEDQVVTYSAPPASYLIATDTNYLYGERSARRGRPERRLFPGVAALLLAVVGLFLRRPPTEVLVYLLALVLAFEMSLGFYGYSFTFLYNHVPVFDSLRAPARLGIFVVFFLGILAAYGHAALAAAARTRAKTALLVGVSAVLLLEYWVAPLSLISYPNSPPELYAWLARQPRGVVAEFPMPTHATLPGNDPRYGYMSTFHWMPMVNGYSGYYPASYLSRLDALHGFPDDRSLQTLVQSGVRYVIVHLSLFPSDPMSPALGQSPHLRELGRFNDGMGPAVVFGVH